MCLYICIYVYWYTSVYVLVCVFVCVCVCVCVCEYLPKYVPTHVRHSGMSHLKNVILTYISEFKNAWSSTRTPPTHFLVWCLKEKLALLSPCCSLNLSLSFLKTVDVLAKEVSIVFATNRTLSR